MPKFIIERDVPGIGDFSPEKTADIIRKIRAALKSTNGQIQWLESFIATDKVFTVYVAPDEAALREFSKINPLPPGPIHLIRSVADPTTAE